MRLYFPSAHRADNVARQLKIQLKKLGITRTDNAIREAVAVACGFRNRNEMLKIMGEGTLATPMDEDTPASVVSERSQAFISKFADALNMDARLAGLAYEAVLPFSGRTFSPRITKSQIEWLAANLSDMATAIKPTAYIHPDQSDRNFIGFALKLNDGYSYSVEVSESGDLRDDDGQQLGTLLTKAGLGKIPNKIEGKSGVANIHILSTFNRLDPKALFVLRCARKFSNRSYRFARSVVDGSQLLRTLDVYPRLGAYIDRQVSTHEEIDISDPAPLETFAEIVRKLSLKKWPSLPVSSERALQVTRNYLSVEPGRDGCILLVPAFLLHMPDDTHPLTTADYEKCEAYLFAKGDLFGSNGMSVSPSSFADVFRSHFGANWEAARQTTKDDSLLATSLAAAVIAQAARESGHLHASSGQFEEPEEEKFVEAFYGLGTALLRENRFSYLEALDRLGQLERLSNARTEQFFKDVENGNDLDKQEVERDKEYFRQVSTILLHPKHRGRTAAEILVEHGFDLPGYIADAGDFGSPDYPAGGSSITPQRKLTAVSAATGTALHPIYISALWHDAISKKSGNTTILIHLTRPLDEILPLKRYRYSGGLNPFSRASADRIYSIQWITHNWDPVEFVCRAARELQFMCATGLVPSKSGGDPGQIGGEFPEWDHASIWTDPSSGATVYASEPYHAAAAEYSCVEWAQLNDSTFVLPKWPGMYTPPWSGLILIARNEHKELLEAARDQLDLLDDCTSPASCNLVEVSENIPFFSPGERMEGRKVALIPPAKNPWKE